MAEWWLSRREATKEDCYSLFLSKDTTRPEGNKQVETRANPFPALAEVRQAFESVPRVVSNQKTHELDLTLVRPREKKQTVARSSRRMLRAHHLALHEGMVYQRGSSRRVREATEEDLAYLGLRILRGREPRGHRIAARHTSNPSLLVVFFHRCSLWSMPSWAQRTNSPLR